MKLGKVEYAERQALRFFDDWVDVTGFVTEGCSYYYELISIVEDAVHCGIQTALYGKITKDPDGTITRKTI